MSAWFGYILLVAAGGGIGGVARFWVSGVVARAYGETFPWGTMVVNVSGSAAIGVLAALLTAPGSHAIANMSLWTALVVGGLGSYTTVSSFALQTLALLRSGETRHAVLNVLGSVLGCLAAVTLGYAATRAALGWT